MKRALLLVCALLLSGCGHERAGSGSASLWVTRDRGATVVLVKTVPAGLTAMQALDRELDVDTAYGGRFVQSIDGVEGDVSKQRDWFWFLNGIESDVSAADYKLRPGDAVVTLGIGTTHKIAARIADILEEQAGEGIF